MTENYCSLVLIGDDIFDEIMHSIKKSGGTANSQNMSVNLMFMKEQKFKLFKNIQITRKRFLFGMSGGGDNQIVEVKVAMCWNNGKIGKSISSVNCSPSRMRDLQQHTNDENSTILLHLSNKICVFFSCYCGFVRCRTA